MSNDITRSAIILPFARKRGRPKSLRNSHDLGTPELIMKRAHGETSEALDLCYEKNLISKNQHWCGVHLRWLYTLRYGAPGVRAIDPTHLGGTDTKSDDPSWRENREQEYNEAITLLGKKGHAIIVLNTCVFNERPKFLKRHARLNEKEAKEIHAILDNLRQGLDILVKHWC